MGIEQLFDGSVNLEPETVIEAPAIEAEAPQPEPEVSVEPVEAPAEPPKEEEQRTVPLATYLDRRDSEKEWRRRAEEAEAKLTQQQPTQAPDPVDDPAGYAAHQKNAIEQSKVETRFEVSDMIARQMHGADKVDQAGQWAAEKAKSDKAFALAYMQQPHPIDWIVQQHQREQMMADIGNDPDAYVRRRAAELGLLTPAPSAAPVAAQQQQAQPAPPPRSLASLPGNGGGGVKDVPVGPMAALETVFKG